MTNTSKFTFYNFWIEAIALITASLVLIASLAWNNAAQEWFRIQRIFSDPLAARIWYAIVTSVIAVLILTILQPYRKGNSSNTGDNTSHTSSTASGAFFWVPM